jgi:hypothetical protein
LILAGITVPGRTLVGEWCGYKKIWNAWQLGAAAGGVGWRAKT